MLRAGASRVAIREALAARVQSHFGDGKTSLLTGESRSVALTRLMLSWADEVSEGSSKATVSAFEQGPRHS
jgi:hypothetical protein